jgi:3-methyl-2-oxobutanoate hydroxymethyltransferase
MTSSSNAADAVKPNDEIPSLYGPGKNVKRVRTRHLIEAKERGEKWAMLTSYDMYTAALFDEAGIPALLVGDSAANNVYGYETTLQVSYP